MNLNIHRHYALLTEQERDAVDTVFQHARGGGLGIFQHFNSHGIVLDGADASERVAEALAKWVYESRGLVKLPPAARPLGELLAEGGTQ